MLPVRKDTLFPDAAVDLAFLSAVVIDRISFVPEILGEIVRIYEDERNYLSLSLSSVLDDKFKVLQIEFGVQDDLVRRSTGACVAQWDSVRSQIGALEIILLDGTLTDISAFVTRLVTYLVLPLTITGTDG